MKKGKAAVKIHVDEEVSIEELAAVIAESLGDEERADLEPFEAYAKGIRQHIQDSMREFNHRFAHGYSLIIEELSKEKE